MPPVSFYWQNVGAQRIYPKKETVALQLTGVSTHADSQQLAITGSLTIKGGKGATGIIVRLREMSPDGAELGDGGTPTHDIADGETITVNIDWETGLLGEFAGRSYFVTVQQVGAESDGTVTEGWLRADRS